MRNYLAYASGECHPFKRETITGPDEGTGRGAKLFLLFFLRRIALLADLAFFGRFDAAFVLAGLAFGFGFFAAGFSTSDGHAGQERHGAKHCGE